MSKSETQSKSVIKRLAAQKSDTQQQQQDVPERIQINNGSGIWEITGARMLPCPENNVRVEYVRRATAEADADLVDEVQRRMDQVVEAAVEWHQSDEDWFEKSEVLAHAIDSLLELRSRSRAQKEGEG